MKTRLVRNIYPAFIAIAVLPAVGSLGLRF